MKREVEGWDGIPLRTHVENAQSTADTAYELAQETKELTEANCDDQATAEARISEVDLKVDQLTKRVTLLEAKAEDPEHE